MTSLVLVILQYVCQVCNMWLEYPEISLLILVAWVYSLYIMLTAHPLFPIYHNGQSRNLI
jgi:hypothetical protein